MNVSSNNLVSIDGQKYTLVSQKITDGKSEEILEILRDDEYVFRVELTKTYYKANFPGSVADEKSRKLDALVEANWKRCMGK